MEVEYNLITEQDIEDFADAQVTPLILIIDEKPVDRPEVVRRYRAYFRDTVLKQGSDTLPAYGSGNTIDDAVDDLISSISDDVIIFTDSQVPSPTPVEISVPTLTRSNSYIPWQI